MYDFSKNDVFQVKGFSDDCPVVFKDKMIAMGIIDGQKLTVKNKSILGGPIAFESDTGTFSLRKKDTKYISLEKI